MNSIKLLILFLTASLIFNSCRKEGCTDSSAVNYDNKAKKDDGSCILAADCDNTSYTYMNDVKPIVDAHCLSCHQSGGTGFASAQLNTYEGVKNSAVSGKLLDAINHRSGASPMPKGAAKLSTEDIKKIECWVAKNAPEN
jgi:cytochrome c553